MPSLSYRATCRSALICTLEIEARNYGADSSAECTEAGCSGNHQSDNDEPMSSGPETEHMCVLVYGGFSGDAVEGDLISIDPGEHVQFPQKLLWCLF